MSSKISNVYLYDSKYLKYKNKYLSLKNMIGKGVEDDKYFEEYSKEAILMEPTQKDLIEKKQKEIQNKINELKKEETSISSKIQKIQSGKIHEDIIKPQIDLKKIKTEIKVLTEEQLEIIDEIIKIQTPDRHLTLKETLTEIQQQIQLLTKIQKQTLEELQNSITHESERRQKKVDDSKTWSSYAKSALPLVGTAIGNKMLPVVSEYTEPYVNTATDMFYTAVYPRLSDSSLLSNSSRY